MANRFQFQSPGAEATDRIEEFLRYQREEQRLAMLDELQKQAQEHGQRMQSENLKLNQNRDARDADAAKRDADMHGEDMFTKRVSNLPYGEVDQSQINPELWSELEKRGMTRTRPGTTATTRSSASLTPPEGLDAAGLEAWAKSIESGEQPATFENTDVTASPERRVFRGSQRFQQEETARERIDELLSKETDPDRIQALLVRRAGVDLPASLEGPVPSVQTVRPDGKPGSVIQGARGRSFMEMGYQPAAYFGGAAANVPSVVHIPDVNDPTKMIPHWLKPGEQPSERNRINSPGPVDKGDLQPVQRPVQIVPQQAWNQLKAARMAQTSGSLRQAGIDQATANIKALAQQNGVSPDVMAVVDDVIADEAERQAMGLPASPIPEILGRMTDVSPDQLAQISALLYGFLSN